MNKTEVNAIKTTVKTGFTFSGDSIFSTYAQARRALNSLVSKGYLEAKSDSEGRVQYIATAAAKDYIQYEVEI